jgi:NADPH:quinone reductase-like Zn-dependent oxidoreductase
VDLVIDLVGGETQERSFTVLKPKGILVSTMSPPSEELTKKYKVHAVMMSMKPSTDILCKLAELFDIGVLRTEVTKVYPLSKAQEAWTDILSRHTHGKIVLQVPQFFKH